MRLKKLNCPNCDGMLDMDVKGKDYVFCPYCGQKFFVEDGKVEHTFTRNVNIKKDININKNITHTNITRNEAEIVRAKAALTKEKLSWIIPLCSIILLVVFFLAMDSYGDKSVKKEELRLNRLVTEIEIDIENGDFDSAEIKANQLYWENSWTSEPEKKWDSTRKTILKQIKNARKEAEKESGESKGLFDWFK